MVLLFISICLAPTLREAFRVTCSQLFCYALKIPVSEKKCSQAPGGYTWFRVCARPAQLWTTFPRQHRVEGVAAGYGRQQRRVQGVQRDAMAAWAERLAGVRGVLLDISGVLYDSGAGGGAAIAGSVDAVARLVGSTRGVVGLLWLPGAGRSRRPRLLAHWPRPSCWLGARWESLGWHC